MKNKFKFEEKLLILKDIYVKFNRTLHREGSSDIICMSDNMVNKAELGGLVWKYSFTSIKRANAFIKFAKQALPFSIMDVTIFRDSASNPTLRLFISFKEYSRKINKQIIDQVVYSFNYNFSQVHASRIDEAIDNCTIEPLLFEVKKDVGIDISILDKFNPIPSDLCIKEDRVKRYIVVENNDTIVRYDSKNKGNLQIFKSLIELIDKIKCEPIYSRDTDTYSFKCKINADFVSIRDQSLSLAKIYNAKTENIAYSTITNEIYSLHLKK